MTAAKPASNTALSRSKWKRSLSGLFIVTVLVSTQMGCASFNKPSEPPAIPASLKMPCPPLQSLNDASGKALLRWSVGTVRLYQDCQDKQRRLVEAWPRN